MASLCLVVQGFASETAQSVCDKVHSVTGLTFNRAALVHWNQVFNKPTTKLPNPTATKPADDNPAWILPLESLQDQQKFLDVLHIGPTLYTTEEMKLGLISQSLIPTPVNWTALSKTVSREGSPDYSQEPLFSNSGDFGPAGLDFQDDREETETDLPASYLYPDLQLQMPDSLPYSVENSFDIAAESYFGFAEESMLYFGEEQEEEAVGEDVGENSVDIYDLLSSMKCDKVIISETQATLLQSTQTRDYIMEKFKAEDLKAVVLADGQGVVTVRAFSDHDLIQAGVIVRTSVVDRKIQLDSNSKDVLGLRSWVDQSNALLDDHKGLLLLSPLSDKEVITGTDQIIEDVAKKVVQFIEENTLHSEVIRISPSRHKFFVRFNRQEIETFCKDHEAQRVDINALWKKKLGEILVKGTKKGLGLAKAKLAEMEAKIVCHAVKEKDPRRVRFLTCDQDYENDLLDLCTECQCIYSQEEETSGLEVVVNAPAPASASATTTTRQNADETPAIAAYHTGYTTTTGHGYGGIPKPIATNTSAAGPDIKIVVVQGDIAEQKADVIVNTTTPELDLKAGAVSSAIFKKGGPELQARCKSKYPKGIKSGEIAVTKGYQLQCQKVFHTTLTGWKPTSKQLLEDVTKMCLKKASDKQYSSIAFPALGTGLLQYPCDITAETLFRTVKQFQRDVPSTSLREVRIVIYHTDTETLKAFQDVERQFQGQSTGLRSFVVPSTTVAPATVNFGWTADLPTPKRQSILVPKEVQLCLYTENRNKTSCVHDFFEKLDKAISKIIVSGELREDSLRSLNDQEKQQIVDVGKQHDVKIQTDTASGRLEATGLRMDVTKVLEEISVIMESVEKRLHEERLAKELEMTKPPSFWAVHKASEAGVKLVSLDPTSGECQAVLDRFHATVGYARPLILSIERVQNPTLYQQYKAKQIHMDKQNTGIENEKILWHGTLQSNVANINLNGFNRGYCGRNATAFGEGVYFAVDASYSMQTTYSPPDAQGRRYIYQSRVLVGHSTPGRRNMKVPPSREGPILYDSLTNSSYKSSVYVIFNDTQAYPEYLITFQ